MAVLFYAADPTPPDPFENFTGDDFTGTNGSPVNPIVWQSVGIDGGFVIQNNKANINIGQSTEKISKSLFEISGDYDIQIDIDSFTSASNFGFIRIGAFTTDLSNAHWVGFERNFGSELKGAIKKNGVITPALIIRSNTFGKLKLTRAGTVFSNYYIDGSGESFALLDSDDLETYENIHIRLYATTPAGSSIVGNLDNFIINSGTVSGA
jgi:hypothetical protein